MKRKYTPKATVQQSLFVSPSTGSMFATGVSFCLGSQTLTVPVGPHEIKIYNKLKPNNPSVSTLVTISTASNNFWGPIPDAQPSYSINAVYDLLVCFYWVYRTVRNFEIPAKQRLTHYFYFLCQDGKKRPTVGTKTYQTLRLPSKSPVARCLCWRDVAPNVPHLIGLAFSIWNIQVLHKF